MPCTQPGRPAGGRSWRGASRAVQETGGRAVPVAQLGSGTRGAAHMPSAHLVQAAQDDTPRGQIDPGRQRGGGGDDLDRTLSVRPLHARPLLASQPRVVPCDAW